MADISVEPKSGREPVRGAVPARSGGALTWVWAIAAIAAIVGLMMWLAAESSELARESAVPEDTAEAGVAGAAGGATAELAAIATDPASFSGQTVSVTGAPVAATLGPRAFWADVPGQNPFLVVVAPDAPNADLVAIGNTLNVQGTVAEVDEATVGEWVASGAIPEAARDEASFATHYLRAERISR